MCGRELPLVLLALVLSRAPRGQTAPAPMVGDPVLAKMYPRGNHWAVGHLMGKKSTEGSPYVDEAGNPEQQLREHLKWNEATRSLLGLLEAKGNRIGQSSPQQLLNHRQPIWKPESVWKPETIWKPETSSNLKDVEAASSASRGQSWALRADDPDDARKIRMWAEGVARGPRTQQGVPGKGTSALERNWAVSTVCKRQGPCTHEKTGPQRKSTSSEKSHNGGVAVGESTALERGSDGFPATPLTVGVHPAAPGSVLLWANLKGPTWLRP
ncbi:PREDICTED: uncharacterized protein LOC102829522 [Chrysochloris asiatica]|uniref:Gastrin-releasing peptide n=1 Tax=Chrysochloris asiatica TaxID=185453 RepID=A0A9B0WJQ5_CHRAS|nr:PREDICTED: uncharacterized protein LOC102829522 [Chrysochloris asiatica]